MTRQRLAANAGVAACLALASMFLAGCSQDLSVDAPSLTGNDAVVCDALVEALPEHVADQPRRALDAGSDYVAAWGEDPIVLRCGVPEPNDFDRFATCQETNGVGWFIPEEQMTGKPEEIVMTTVGFEQNIEVRLPTSHWPPAAAMVDLAPAIKNAVRELKPCV